MSLDLRETVALLALVIAVMPTRSFARELWTHAEEHGKESGKESEGTGGGVKAKACYRT